MRWFTAIAVLGCMHLSADAASGQELITCPAGRISAVTVQNHSVFDTSDPDRGGRLAWAYRLANNLHVQTRSEVVERELLFGVGDCYDVELMLDTERLLRGFNFLADASINVTRLPSGDVELIVNTQDEWSTRIEPRVSSDGAMGLEGLRLVEDNLAGTGRHLALFYDRIDEDRIFGVSYATPHLFDSRWNMALQASRTEVGYSYHAAVAYPFVGESGRVAFKQELDRQDRIFELQMPVGTGDDLSRVWVPVSRERVEVGAAFRWGGQRYRHTLIGAALAGERFRYPDPLIFADAEIRRARLGEPPPVSWSPISSVRLMLLAGQRNVFYVRRHAVETVNGNEDIPLGVEAEASIGPTLPSISEDRDIAVGLRLAASGEMHEALMTGGQFVFEGRRSYDAIPGLPEWHDVLAEVDLWAFFRPSPDSKHQWVLSGSALGGWHSRVPFQLTLGGDAGLRGHPAHVDPGGRRVVGAFEYRAYLGWPLPRLFDLGTVVFADVGKIWPGHAPFGTDSAVRASAGFGIRAAFPPGSRQTFRLDVGMPIEYDVGLRNLTVTIGVGQTIGRGALRRDPQLLRSARYGIATSDFEHNTPP